VVAVLARDAGELDRALDHARGRVAEAVHDAVGKRAVVRADAHGDAARLAEIDQRLEGLVDARELVPRTARRCLDDGELLFVGEVAGIDAHLLDPLRGFHGGVGLEVDVGDDGHIATGGVQLGADVLLKFRRVFTVGAVMRTISQPTLTRSSVCLTHSRVVHRVAGEHRLDANRVRPATPTLPTFTSREMRRW